MSGHRYFANPAFVPFMGIPISLYVVVSHLSETDVRFAGSVTGGRAANRILEALAPHAQPLEPGVVVKVVEEDWALLCATLEHPQGGYARLFSVTPDGARTEHAVPARVLLDMIEQVKSATMSDPRKSPAS